MRQLNGRVVVITGAANGIGRAMAEAFATQGARLVLADIETGPLGATAAALRDAGTDCVAVQTDVASAESVERLRLSAMDAFGAVHVICNNAGVTVGGRAMSDLSLADWEWTLGVNLWGVIHGVHAFVPLLREQEEAHVVNTASGAALSGSAYTGPYSASKAAILSLSETLYRELAQEGAPIGVSVLLPGAIRTTIGRSEERRPDRLRTTPPSNEHTPAAVGQWFSAQREGGLNPSVAAAAVIDGVLNNRFYLFPGGASGAAAAARHADVVAGCNPTVHPLSYFALKK
jgi:NAD(P)-dependent dehydrogenase (short-subunit alcohol dehydrogenase family)